MADFISNQEELERLSKEAQQAQLEKSAATDKLKEGMRIGSILGLPRSAGVSEIMAGVQPNNAGAQAVQQAWERPAALEQQTSSQNYQDLLNKYKTLKETGLKDYQLSLETRKAELADKRQAATERHQEKMEEIAANKLENPKMGAAEKEKYTIGLSALKAVGDMDKALLEGGRKGMISLVGDSPYTMAKRTFAEMLGRLQSGGAINKDEEARFNKMAPTVLDSPEIAKSKLKNLKEMMEQRIEIYSGKKPAQSELAYGKTPSKGLIATGIDKGIDKLESKAIAADLPQIGTIQDGYKFLGGNPADPKSWQEVR